MTDIIVGIGSFVAGVIYPSYMSFKAIKSSAKEDDIQWLSYWVIFSLVQLVEFVLGFILEWIPFFGVIKFVGLLYLVLPTFKGAELLFLKVDPILTKYIDIVEKKLSEKFKSIAAPPKTATPISLVSTNPTEKKIE